MHSLSLCILFIFALTCGYAQKNLQKGKIVTIAGDTIRGFIDQKEWARNPETISFTTSEQSPLTTYTPKAIQYFELDNRVYYKTFAVSITMDKVSIDNLYPDKDPAVVDTVFLRILLTGKNVNVFVYNDRIKTRYYLQENGGQPEELLYRMFSKVVGGAGPTAGQRISITQDIYKSQLLDAVQEAGINTPALTSRIKKMNYGTGIVDIAQKINGDETKITKTRRLIGFNIYGGAGVAKNDMTYKAQGGWEPKSSSNYGPYFALGGTFFGNRDVRKTAVRVDLSWNTASIHTVAPNHGYTYNEAIDYQFKQSNFGLAVGFQYGVFRTKTLTINIGAGVKFNKSTFSKNQYTISDDNYKTVLPDFFELSKSTQDFNLQFGVLIKNRIEILANYYIPTSILNNNAPAYEEKLKSVRLGVNYAFWKK